MGFLSVLPHLGKKSKIKTPQDLIKFKWEKKGAGGKVDKSLYDPKVQQELIQRFNPKNIKKTQQNGRKRKVEH